MKKKIAISKKLAFTKATVAVLSDAERNLIAGGNRGPITNQPNCTTIIVTCQTVQMPGEPCMDCQ
ncbi:class I lanthipeptide [Chitinophaga qingshengii]|uniref:Class I lanthipeptide n=1 Tax=Chitinophaga qingshengii TaxID=1569794 RepID=A0ABR7TTT4_9BACT|nr:class I lanthipeptide [Chitinophaga qingshengii]MBC9932861.1 class I lanthipeptide [Chitinophaga qingshengii]